MAGGDPDRVIMAILDAIAAAIRRRSGRRPAPIGDPAARHIKPPDAAKPAKTAIKKRKKVT